MFFWFFDLLRFFCVGFALGGLRLLWSEMQPVGCYPPGGFCSEIFFIQWLTRRGCP